jgi:glyoxylase-like metal-dependent hydrolase (beta-lactamase superfamily II)
MDAMQAGLKELGVGYKANELFITHLHADHIGLLPSIAADTSTIYFNRPGFGSGSIRGYLG